MAIRNIIQKKLLFEYSDMSQASHISVQLNPITNVTSQQVKSEQDSGKFTSRVKGDYVKK